MYPAIYIPDWSDMVEQTDVVGRRGVRHRRQTIRPEVDDSMAPDFDQRTLMVLPIDNGKFESCTSDSFSKLPVAARRN